MPSRHVEDLCPEMRTAAHEFLQRLADDLWFRDHGIFVIVTDGWRSPEDQFAKFKQGRDLQPDGRWIVTGRTVTTLVAGAHNLGAAFDAAPKRAGHLLYPDVLKREGATPAQIIEAMEAFARMGSVGERLGLRWGGRFSESVPGAGDGWDQPHMEIPTWRDMMAAMPST